MLDSPLYEADKRFIVESRLFLESIVRSTVLRDELLQRGKGSRLDRNPPL